MTGHALERGYEVVGVCRPGSFGKLAQFRDRSTILPGRTDDRTVIEQALRGCDGDLTAPVPWGVQGSDLEEGPGDGLPVWSRHVGHPILASSITRRTDFALFMVAALTDDTLIHEAPAIVSCRSASAQAQKQGRRGGDA